MEVIEYQGRAWRVFKAEEDEAQSLAGEALRAAAALALL